MSNSEQVQKQDWSPARLLAGPVLGTDWRGAWLRDPEPRVLAAHPSMYSRLHGLGQVHPASRYSHLGDSVAPDLPPKEERGGKPPGSD